MAWSHQGPSVSVVQNKLGIHLALWQPLWMSDTEGLINMETAHGCLRHSHQSVPSLVQENSFELQERKRQEPRFLLGTRETAGHCLITGVLTVTPLCPLT